MTAIEGKAVPGGKGLKVVVNSSAGSGASSEEWLHAELPDAEVIGITDDLPMGRALERAAAAAAVIGISGGDGSVNAAAERALDAGLPLAVFPGGTLNHFARDLGLADAADTVRALEAGTVVAIDVGTIDGKPFLNTASFGAYAAFVDARERLESRLGKWAAAFVAAARVLRTVDPLTVELDGRRSRVWMIFIGNCEYRPAGLVPTSRDRLDDGLLDVRYVDGNERGSRLRLLGALALGRLDRARGYRRALVGSLDVHSLDGPLRLARDGETFDGGVDVRVAKRPDRLTVYAPGDAPRP